MSGAILTRPLYVFMAWTVINLRFYFLKLRPLMGPFSINRLTGNDLQQRKTGHLTFIICTPKPT